MRVQSLGQEDALEEGMATHSSILAWRIPRTEKPGRLSMGLQRVGHNWATELNWTNINRKLEILGWPKVHSGFSVRYYGKARMNFLANWQRHTCMHAKSLSLVRLSATSWTVACQAPLFMRFSRQEYWSELPCPPPGHLPDPGIEPTSLTYPALAGWFFTTGTTWKAHSIVNWILTKILR